MAGVKPTEVSPVQKNDSAGPQRSRKATHAGVLSDRPTPLRPAAYWHPKVAPPGLDTTGTVGPWTSKASGLADTRDPFLGAAFVLAFLLLLPTGWLEVAVAALVGAFR